MNETRSTHVFRKTDLSETVIFIVVGPWCVHRSTRRNASVKHMHVKHANKEIRIAGYNFNDIYFENVLIVHFFDNPTI